MERQMQPMEDNDKEASTSFHVSPSLGNTTNLPLLGNTTILPPSMGNTTILPHPCDLRLNPVYANHSLVCSNTLPTEHILEMTSSITQQRHVLGPNSINDEGMPRRPTIVYANGRHHRHRVPAIVRDRRNLIYGLDLNFIKINWWAVLSLIGFILIALAFLSIMYCKNNPSFCW